MDQSNPQAQDDREWEDLNKPKEIIAKDVIEKLKRIGPKAYAHQFEFLQYMLGQDVKNQAPIIALRSLTGSGKTLCFQSIIYQNYRSDIHSKIDLIKPGRDGKKEKRVLTPYAIVLGNTIFLKQHEEEFEKFLPTRLKEQGLRFQTFFALTKDSQFQGSENKIEEANAQVLLCHPSKLFAGIKLGVINCKNLRYLIIDEADTLLKKDARSEERTQCINIISFILGQQGSHPNLSYQIIFVSASLKQTEIQELLEDVIMKNFESGSNIDPRFVSEVQGTKTAKFEIKFLPSVQSDSIAPYSIRHFYIQPQGRGQKKKFLADVIGKVFNAFDAIQVMVFFNTKLANKKIEQVLAKDDALKFLVEKQQIVACTGDNNQKQREDIRKDFRDNKFKILLCTDVLQRGLDFRQVRLIIHFGLPRDSTGKFQEELYKKYQQYFLSYFQRSGRTGRAKDEGAVLTILSQKDLKERKSTMMEILKKTGSKIEEYKDETFLKDVETVLQFNKPKQQ